MQITLQGFTDATALFPDANRLREKADEEGYLYLKRFLPRQEILELRRQMLVLLDRRGWINRDTDLMAARADMEAMTRFSEADLGTCGTSLPDDLYVELQRLESFQRMAHHPRLLQLYELLLGAPFIPHPRKIARIMLPNRFLRPTPPHQDFIHIQGTTSVWTCWIPLGDCPMELGGLSIMRGSHRKGLLPVKSAEGQGGLEAWLCQQEDPWLANDFEAGDVITFPSLTVHKALSNQTGDHIRISCDMRYQRIDEPILPSSLTVYGELCDWAAIYDGWESKDLQYYWKEHDLRFCEWNDSIRWQKEKIC